MSLKDDLKNAVLDEARSALVQLPLEALKAIVTWLRSVFTNEPNPADYVARKLQADAAHVASRATLRAALERKKQNPKK